MLPFLFVVIVDAGRSNGTFTFTVRADCSGSFAELPWARERLYVRVSNRADDYCVELADSYWHDN